MGFARTRLCSRRVIHATLLLALSGLVSLAGHAAQAGGVMEERKLPMRFVWNDCQPDCRADAKGWIAAVGVVTADSPRDFDDFARGRDLVGATIVLDSSGGSVNDAIALGRRWRKLGLATTVGSAVDIKVAGVERSVAVPDAYCESMCAFLLLAGTTRYVGEESRVRVHQIWMGDRADDARAASYSAQDLMIVERDIGRLAKYTFDMGGSGDLLLLALNVPPWEDLHELSRDELKLTNIKTTDTPLKVFQRGDPLVVSGVAIKPVQDRVAADASSANEIVKPARAKSEAQVAGGVLANAGSAQ